MANTPVSRSAVNILIAYNHLTVPDCSLVESRQYVLKCEQEASTSIFVICRVLSGKPFSTESTN